MPAPATDPPGILNPNTGESALYVTWPALTTEVETGGSAVTSYHLQWDAGAAEAAGATTLDPESADWRDVVGQGPASLLTEATRTTGVVAGRTHLFQLRASNRHGWGAWSPTLAVKAARRPHQMATVTTSIDAATGGVKIQWVAPADGSDAITGYLIQVADANGAYYTVLSESTTDCVTGPGALSAANYCVLPMSVLAAATAPLAFGTLVQVQAQASNSYGLSDASIANSDPNGARIRRVPDQMPVPTVVSVTEAKIVLEWQPLTAPANGDSPVTAYNVLWDNGSGTAALVLHDDIATTVEAPGLTPGVNYRFKLRARNIYGDGAFSAVPGSPDGLLVVLASDRPDKVAIPSVTIGATETAVTISWQKPGHHAAEIDAYEILLLTAAGGFTTEPTSCDGVSGAAPSVTAASIVDALQCVVPMAAL
jgi:hypothetical protein